MPDVTPLPKKRKPKKARRGRARPNDPLAEFCEAQLPVCLGAASCRHHKVRRSQGGGDGPESTADLCATCHVYIHANPAWSYEHGWLVRSTR